MKVTFLGFQTWGTVSLAALLRSRHLVQLVITHPSSDHEYETIWTDSVKDLAIANSIPVYETKRVNNDEMRELIVQSKSDILVLSDWRTWVSPDIYMKLPFQGINIHDSLLPRYGGFAPINWAILNGEIETGVTAHFLSPEFDLGDIIIQRSIPISPQDTATDIFWRVIAAIPEITIQALDLIEKGAAPRIPQDKNTATFYHKRTRRDSLIDWTRSNEEIYNLVRAQSDPYPNAYTFYKGRRLMVKTAARPHFAYRGSPGRLLGRTDDGVILICGNHNNGSSQGLIVRTVQEEGAPTVPANEYFDHMGYYLPS